jgi:hypothetical protein
MPVLDPNEIFFTAFEPKVVNRFVMYVDGIPSYFIKGVTGVEVTSEEITLNHINVYRKVKGKTKWSDISMTFIRSYHSFRSTGCYGVGTSRTTNQ